MLLSVLFVIGWWIGGWQGIITGLLIWAIIAIIMAMVEVADAMERKRKHDKFMKDGQ